MLESRNASQPFFSVLSGSKYENTGYNGIGDRQSPKSPIIADLTGQMSGAAKKPIPPEWSEIGDGPIVAWSVGVEKKGERFKLRFRETVLDAEEESGKRPIRSVSRLS